MRILIADKLAPFVAARLQDLGATVSQEPSLKGEALTAKLKEQQPHGLIVRSTKVSAANIKASIPLGLIIRAGAGVNTIDIQAASAAGVYVANCPGKNASAVAELAIGHLVNLDRRIADGVAQLRAGQWNKQEFGKARGLRGRRLALLGFGGIGKATAKIALSMGMEVVAWSRSLTPERAQTLGVAFAPTPEAAVKGADAVSVHLAQTAETQGRVGQSVFDAMKAGAYFINTARAGVVDQAALFAAIESKNLRAGLDVFEGEPAVKAGPFEGELSKLGAVYGTHHIGASTEQAEEAVGEEVVNIVSAFYASAPIPNCVNLSQLTAATHALVVRHANEVGVLASVLGVLSQAGHNVEEMQNTIFSQGGAAVARITLAGKPSAATVEALRSAPGVFAVGISCLG